MDVYVGYDDVHYEQEILRLTNVEREANGLPALIWDSRLGAAARSHSTDMAQRDYFSHISPEGEGPGERLRKEGYSDIWMENIAAGAATPSDVVAGWMGSEVHRANILNPGFTHVGVGVCYREEATYRYYYTQDFGRIQRVN